MLAVGITEAFGHEIEPPGYITIGRLVAAQFVWPTMPLRLAYLLFQRPDVCLQITS